MAYQSQGVKLFWSTLAYTTNGSTAGINATATQLVGEVTDFTGPGGAAAVIDITHLQSTAKEKMIGLRDEGQVSMSLNFNATDTGQVNLIADRASRTKRNALIKFADSDTNAVAFGGYCLQFSISGAVDNKISANAVIEIDGAVSYTTG